MDLKKLKKKLIAEIQSRSRMSFAQMYFFILNECKDIKICDNFFIENNYTIYELINFKRNYHTFLNNKIKTLKS